MAISTTQRNAFNSCSTTLKTSLTSATQTTGIILNALIRNKATVAWPALAGCVLRFYGSGYEEFVGCVSATLDSDNNVTLVTVTRDLPWNDGTSYTTAGGGRAWPAGTRVDLVLEARHMQNMAFLDLANTFAAQNTFSVNTIFSKGLRLTPFANTGARDAYFTSPTNGDKCYVTGTGEQVYSGGAWVTVNASSNSFGSTTVAGTFEEATVAEQAAATATGGTGARLIPAVANMVTTSAGAGDVGKIPVLNSSGLIDATMQTTVTPSKGGTGLATLTTNNLLVGAGTSNVTFIAPGIAGTTLVSGGTTATFKAPPSLASTVVDSAAIGASSTSKNYFTDQTYVIPAASVAAGDVFHIFGTFVQTGNGTPNLTLRLEIGTTVLTALISGTANGANYSIDSYITIRTTGASGTLRASSYMWYALSPGVNTAVQNTYTGAGTLDFTATQTINFSQQFDASNGANTVKLVQFFVHKTSL